MSRIADFSAVTKTQLAKRAGNHCSFPNCYAPTDGPSDESSISTSSTGMACHIIAASDGPAARRVQNISVEKLSDLSNGIWMCYTHGKLIDTDECQYSVSLLKHWNKVAELKAKLAQQHGWSLEFDPKLFSDLKLPEHAICLSELSNINHPIGVAIHDCCAATLWGKRPTEATRDLVIELARNAFEHGKASEVKVEITPLSIRVIDNGNSFDTLRLGANNKGAGGALAISHLTSQFKHCLYLSYERKVDLNMTEIAIVRSANDVKSLTSCTVTIDPDLLRYNKTSIAVEERCGTVYVIFPSFFALSDAIRLPELVSKMLPKGREYVFVGHALSEYTLEVINEKLPGIRVINFEYK